MRSGTPSVLTVAAFFAMPLIMWGASLDPSPRLWWMAWFLGFLFVLFFNIVRAAATFRDPQLKHLGLPVAAMVSTAATFPPLWTD